MKEPEGNKAVQPSQSKEKVVKVRINKNRAITGVGKAGAIVPMTETLAKKYASEGYVTILTEEEHG